MTDCNNFVHSPRHKVVHEKGTCTSLGKTLLNVVNQAIHINQALLSLFRQLFCTTIETNSNEIPLDFRDWSKTCCTCGYRPKTCYFNSTWPLDAQFR